MEDVKDAKEEKERLPITSAADYSVPIEEVGGLLARLDDEPPRPRILTVNDELIRFLNEAEKPAD